MSSRQTTNVKELEQKIYVLQKEKNHIIDSYESQLDQAKEREKKLNEKVSHFQKKNLQLHEWIQSKGFICELLTEIENDELLLSSAGDNDDDESHNNMNASTEIPLEVTCLQSDLEKTIEEKKYFENEMKRLLNEMQEMKGNYQNLKAKCKAHEKTIENYSLQISKNLQLIDELSEIKINCSAHERMIQNYQLQVAENIRLSNSLLEIKNQLRDFLMVESRFAMLPSFDEFLGLRWELSNKAVPNLMLDTIMPTSALNSITTDKMAMPLMLLPPSSTNDGRAFLFQLYLTREASTSRFGKEKLGAIHLYIKIFDNLIENQTNYNSKSYSITNERKLCLMIFSDSQPMKTFIKELPREIHSIEKDPELFLMIPETSFNPSTGWVISIR